MITGILDGSLNLSISKMGESYINVYKDYERGTGNISLSFLIQTLTYPFYLITLILGVYYFKYLPKTYKYLVIFSFISIIVIETIGHGKQKQLGDILVFLSIVTLLKYNIQDKIIRKKIIKKLFVFATLGVSLLLLVLYFRYSALNIDILNINDKIHPLMNIDTEHSIYTIFGNTLGFSLTQFSGYISQGYYGLSLCMQEPFQWTYFVGNSYSVSVLFQRFFDIPIDFHDTYPYRLALHSEWTDNKWSTVFAWFAGDFTFVGTLFFFSFIGFFYAKVWKESYLFKNPISVLLFVNISIGLLYIPANNQLLHTPGSVISVFLFIIFWIFKHKKYNKINNV